MLTTNLAVALANLGAKVGIIDADIYGFSIPKLIGLEKKNNKYEQLAHPTSKNKIMPCLIHNVQVVSIGMFLDGNNNVVAWRGPLLHRTLNQFLFDVSFMKLDFLIIDMPPGTGDIAISLTQLMPRAKIIIITTPQIAAVSIAKRSGLLAQKNNQQIFGIVENMTGLQNPDGSITELFGHGGGNKLATELTQSQSSVIKVLAQIPLSVLVASSCDNGEPIVISAKNDPAAIAINNLAKLIIN